MANALIPARWSYRALFVALAGLVAFVQLLPLNPGPGQIPGPDVLVLLTFAWVLRRPEYLPVWLIAPVFLMADFLFMRPPGLWSGLVVIASEMLRNRVGAVREYPFVGEWLLVAAVILGMTLADRLVLTILAVDQPALGLSLIRLIATALCYPLAVALAARPFGIRRPLLGDGTKSRAAV